MRVPAAFQAYLAHFRRSGRATAFRKNCSQVNNRDPVYQALVDHPFKQVSKLKVLSENPKEN
jgi:hypothetical protein